MKKEKVAIVTLGCDKNRVDSEVMAGILKEEGYELTLNTEESDFVIINTCTFIEEARMETETAIENALKNKKAKVIISGCHVQRFKEKIREKYPDAWGFLDINQVENIANILGEIKRGKKVESFDPPTFLYRRHKKRLPSTLPGSAYVKIGEGCNHNCTFCIIPKIKGRARSRRIEEIIDEVKYLTSLGIKEIILIAQDLNSYGIDLYGKPMLSELAEKLTKIDKLEWIRFLYMYPFNFPYEILELMNESKKICRYIDLPLQHISDNILKRMGRKGSKKDILALIGKIREKVPDITLRTSFIVGFPGETEENFFELKEFIEKIRFHWVGVFEYSPEEGTYAYTLKDQISRTIKKQRRINLMALQKSITSSINKKRVGNIEEVLIEEKLKDNLFLGRSQKEAPEIDGRIMIYRAKEEDLGQIKKIRIISSSDYDLSGVLDS